MSWKGVITDAGKALLAQWAAGSQTLTIDGADVGSGVTAEEALHSATALSSRKDRAQIVSSKGVTGGTQFKILVGPAASVAYTAREIGIWAHLGSGSSVLLALHQDADGGGVGIPTADVSPSFAFALYVVHSFSNDGTLEVTIDTSAYVTASDLEEALAVVEEELAFSGGLSPQGPLILKAGVHYFESVSELPTPGTPGRVAFVRV